MSGKLHQSLLYPNCNDGQSFKTRNRCDGKKKNTKCSIIVYNNKEKKLFFFNSFQCNVLPHFSFCLFLFLFLFLLQTISSLSFFASYSSVQFPFIFLFKSFLLLSFSAEFFFHRNLFFPTFFHCVDFSLPFFLVFASLLLKL